MDTELSTPNTRREREVWQACDDLWAQSPSSRHLTGDNIRDRLVQLGYKRGSPNEIYRYRSSWKQSRGISDTQDEAETESRVSDPISRAVSLVYEQMRSQTSETIDKLTEDYETRLKAALIEEDRLRNELAKQANENAGLTEHLGQIQKRLSELEQQLLQERREGAVLNERLKGAKEQLEMAGVEHRALIMELKSFHEREVDLWRSQNAELQRAMVEQKKEFRAEAERQGALFSEELLKLKTELRQSNEERARAEGQLAAFQQVVESEEEKTKVLEELLTKHNDESLVWQRKVERLLHRKGSSTVPRTLGRMRRSKSQEFNR